MARRSNPRTLTKAEREVSLRTYAEFAARSANSSASGTESLSNRYPTPLDRRSFLISASGSTGWSAAALKLLPASRAAAALWRSSTSSKKSTGSVALDTLDV